MHWLQTLDVGLFRFINETLSNPVFVALMPFASGNRFFFPVVLAAAAMLLWKGGARGRLCLLMLALIVWPGDSFVSNTIKHAVARPRPFVTLAQVRLPASEKRDGAVVVTMGTPEDNTNPESSRAGYNSMPSSHAANWFAATMIFVVYYRRSWRFMLPLAFIVAFSRVYNGVHYPSDVLAGAILGAGCAAAGMLALDALWQWVGRKWFPLWWEALPSLVNAEGRMRNADCGIPTVEESGTRDSQALIEQHWLRLGYALIGVSLLLGLGYLAAGVIELSEDEAYQWIWSKHLALSYYSKPPLIAYTQFLGTHLWGNNAFGVRFFSPVIGSVLGFLLLRFFAREVNARAGFFVLLIVTATPLMALGSILMTVDPLSVLFWTAAMIAGWRAVKPDGTTVSWLWTGLWMGMGFLSKYTELFQWLCWIVFFILWKPARAHLRRPGPWLALLINLVCTLPVVIWNRQHHWITVTHVGEVASVGNAWHPTLRHFFDFVGAETALLNPVFFGAALWAAIVFWRRNRHDPRLVYLFSMGAPLFLSYWLYTFHSGVLPNWIAPSVLPLFCMMAIYWDTRWRLGVRAVKGWCVAGLIIGVPLVVLLHDTDLIGRIAAQPLPPKPDPLTRVRAYRALTEVVEQARAKLQEEGKPVFIIGAHYGITGLMTFYLPEARTNVVDHPLVYCLSSDRPIDQFYFWPGYREQCRGQNAIFVRQLSAPPLVHGWVTPWLAGQVPRLQYQPHGSQAPASLLKEFDSVTDLGLHDILYRGRVFHTIQLFECRSLR